MARRPRSALHFAWELPIDDKLRSVLARRQRRRDLILALLAAGCIVAVVSAAAYVASDVFATMVGS
jgi:hypothetical protein